MGKHFDLLVEFARHYMDKKKNDPAIGNLHNSLENMINDCALFEIPVNTENLFPLRGEDLTEYQNYLCDYFDLSKENNSFFLTPFKITAVEDLVSVVVAKNIGENKYLFFQCKDITEKAKKEGFPLNGDNYIVDGGIAEVAEPKRDDTLLLGRVEPKLCCMISNGKDLGTPYSASKDFALKIDAWIALICYIQEFVYLMDPEIFILEKENNQSKRYSNKTNKSKKSKKKKSKQNKLRKTIMRPHYVCLSEDDLKYFLKNSSKEPRAAHPVRGHWRKLRSDRFVNKQGKTIFIRQYFTGQGEVKSNNGWTYNVMLKQEIGKLTRYSSNR